MRAVMKTMSVDGCDFNVSVINNRVIYVADSTNKAVAEAEIDHKLEVVFIDIYDKDLNTDRSQQSSKLYYGYVDDTEGLAHYVINEVLRGGVKPQMVA